jgi:hypothetical protein
VITLFVNKEEHIFVIQFKLPLVNDRSYKKGGGWPKYINSNRGNYLDESIRTNPIRYGGIILV